ncbi:MAG: DUF202 domain-containing protein [Phycisphaerales bacterium]|nr:DUF202 domain-containing protein [Phycisphaerales bacterium]
MDASDRGESGEPRGDLRVFYAAQRTMLAWVRTGVALMGFGFVVARFGLFLREIAVARQLTTSDIAQVPRSGLSVWAGTGLLVIGVAVTVLGAWRFHRFAREFSRGVTIRPTGVAAELLIAAMVAGIGVALTTYLALLR